MHYNVLFKAGQFFPQLMMQAGIFLAGGG